MIKRKANTLLVAVLFLSLCSKAQYHYTASLDTVKATGFYSVTITPELSSCLKTDLSDLRITDVAKKQNIPFIIDAPYGKQTVERSLFDQKIIKKITKDENTILIIENEKKYELANFVIQLKSAAAERTASLSGSDDSVHWYVILDSLLIHKSGEYDPGSHSQRINFPESNYKYFRFVIHNGVKEPLNILKAGSSGTDSPFETSEFIIVNPPPAFSQIDSAGYSLITITNGRPFHITKIRLNIAGPWLYKRQAKIFTETTPGLLATWNSNSHASITISSDSFSGYSIPFLKSATFYVLINNGDNPPLKIASISTEQTRRNVIAQLEAGVSYSLLLDDPQATAPNYDLQHFRERIREITPISTNKITSIPSLAEIRKKRLANWWIWPALATAVILLALLAWRLTTDMKKKGNSQQNNI
jgi:hypothetical protein